MDSVQSMDDGACLSCTRSDPGRRIRAAYLQKFNYPSRSPQYNTVMELLLPILLCYTPEYSYYVHSLHTYYDSKHSFFYILLLSLIRSGYFLPCTRIWLFLGHLSSDSSGPAPPAASIPVSSARISPEKALVSGWCAANRMLLGGACAHATRAGTLVCQLF